MINVADRGPSWDLYSRELPPIFIDAFKFMARANSCQLVWQRVGRKLHLVTSYRKFFRRRCHESFCYEFSLLEESFAFWFIRDSLAIVRTNTLLDIVTIKLIYCLDSSLSLLSTFFYYELFRQRVIHLSDWHIVKNSWHGSSQKFLSSVWEYYSL